MSTKAKRQTNELNANHLFYIHYKLNLLNSNLLSRSVMVTNFAGRCIVPQIIIPLKNQKIL